jgi:hypothetical protein
MNLVLILTELKMDTGRRSKEVTDLFVVHFEI